MTAVEFIQQRFQAFGGQLSEVEILDITLSVGVSSDDEVTVDNIGVITVAIIKAIPTLLLRANSVSENGFSLSWDKSAIMDYYHLMCKRYGLTDELNQKPTVEFL